MNINYQDFNKHQYFCDVKVGEVFSIKGDNRLFMRTEYHDSIDQYWEAVNLVNGLMRAFDDDTEVIIYPTATIVQ